MRLIFPQIAKTRKARKWPCYCAALYPRMCTFLLSHRNPQFHKTLLSRHWYYLLVSRPGYLSVTNHYRLTSMLLMPSEHLRISFDSRILLLPLIYAPTFFSSCSYFKGALPIKSLIHLIFWIYSSPFPLTLYSAIKIFCMLPCLSKAP